MVNLYLTAGKLQQVEIQVQNYNMLFWLCISGMALFGLVTIFLFFYFNIGNVFMELTGIRRRQEIGKMYKKRKSVSAARKQDRKQRKIQNRPEEITEKIAESVDETVVLQEDYMDVGETTVLEAPMDFIIEKELSITGTDESL